MTQQKSQLIPPMYSATHQPENCGHDHPSFKHKISPYLHPEPHIYHLHSPQPCPPPSRPPKFKLSANKQSKPKPSHTVPPPSPPESTLPVVVRSSTSNPRRVSTQNPNTDNPKQGPYSNFRVGCTALLADGTTVSGANVECASFPVGTCAERCVLVKVVVCLAFFSPAIPSTILLDRARRRHRGCCCFYVVRDWAGRACQAARHGMGRMGWDGRSSNLK